MTIKVESLGCRLNALEGDAIRHILRDKHDSDMVIINGCAVTAQALRQTRQAARRARREDSKARIIVTGCAAQTDTARFAQMPEVDMVLGNDEKLSAENYQTKNPTQVGDIMVSSQIPNSYTPPAAPQQTRQRGFVQVQNGCDHRCTFCIIPYGRGNSRSVALTHIIEQCRTLYDNGHNEIVLTGVDLTSYKTGEVENLGALVRQILHAVPHLPRLRLSSVDAIELDDTLLDLLAHEPRLMPHLHLSLQSGDDLILKRMKRRHSRAQAIALCEDLRAMRDDIAFTADIIAGFPTETEAAAENSRTLIEICGLAHTHIFPFSPRPDTPAARMPQHPAPLIKERAAILRKTAKATTQDWLAQQVGRTMRVLVEQTGIGRSENFARVHLSHKECSSAHKAGDIITLSITAHDDTSLIGEKIGQQAEHQTEQRIEPSL